MASSKPIDRRDPPWWTTTHKLTDDGRMRVRIARLGPLQYWSLVLKSEHAPAKCRSLSLFDWHLARGPLEGIYAGHHPDAHVHVLRESFPSITLTYDTKGAM